jgi:hypothetical protein
LPIKRNNATCRHCAGLRCSLSARSGRNPRLEKALQVLFLCLLLLLSNAAYLLGHLLHGHPQQLLFTLVGNRRQALHLRCLRKLKLAHGGLFLGFQPLERHQLEQIRADLV